ncbi:MAG: Mut7-C RNAse domain-containing protein [Patescibacteria group bacterium]|nr:Mut7-C RNAse domain-containing protein [Patescibacteria group bacterium]
MDKKELIKISLMEDRIIITRNTRIKKENAKYLILIEQNPYMQFKRLYKELKLDVNNFSFFTRCSICNLDLEKTDKNLISNKIPQLTYLNTNDFFICPNCKKIYWKQSHYDFFINKIIKLIYDKDNF